jgi:hypothetical protein
VRQLSSGEDVAFGNQLQPVRDEVVHRALPLAVRVTATQAAVSLLRSLSRFEGVVDFYELFFTLTQQFLLRVFAPDFDELEVVVETFSHFNTSSSFRRILIAGWHGCWRAAT